MEINIMEIVDLLDHYYTEYTISEKEYEWIRDVVLAEGDTRSLNPHLLYLCDAEHFQEILKLNTPGNVLLVCPDTFLMKKMDSNKINLIQMVSTENIENVYETISELFLRKSEFVCKKTKLVDALLSCKGLQHIIDVGHEVIGNPMFVSDLGYNVLAFNKNVSVMDPSWPTANPKEEFEAYERIKKLNDSGVFERLYKSDVPCIENFDYSPTRWMAHKITINEKNIGHIAVVESEKSFEDMDLNLLQFLCGIVASELQKDNNHHSHYHNEFEHFFTDLLEEKTTSFESIHKRGQSLNLNMKKYMMLVTISPGNKKRNGMSLSYIRTFINRLLNTEKSILYKNKITVLLLRDRKEAFSEDTENKLKDFLKSNEMNAGISQCFQEVATLKKYYLQSIKAMKLGVSLNDREQLFYYDDYSIYHLLEIAGAQSDLKNFCNPAVFDLIAYDRQYKTDYCHNLYMHLLNDASITKTSEFFKIHRNSMKYRIKKIEEILNISLDDMDIKLSLIMTFKILIYIGENNF